MSKIVNFAIILMLFLTGCATKNTDYAVIKGNLTPNSKTEIIEFSKLENGVPVEMVRVTPKNDGRFSVMVPISEPEMYLMTAKRKDGSEIELNNFLNRFWLEAGEEIDITVTDNSYNLNNSKFKENRILSSWNKKADTLYYYSNFMKNSTTYEDYFPVLPEFEIMVNDFLSSNKTRNKVFNNFLTLVAEVDLAYTAVQFLTTPRTKHPQLSQYPDYYRRMVEKFDFSSTEILLHPYAKRFIGSFVSLKHRLVYKADSPTRPNRRDEQLKYLQNDTIKGIFLTDQLFFFDKYNETFIKFKDFARPYLVTPYLQKLVSDRELKIRTFEEGALAFEIKGKNMAGNEIKLSDFKGNIVYVDIWATWCGPCQGEIPHFKQLEKEFKGKPIVFFSISVDDPKNKAKWENFVKEKQLEGVQLFAQNGFSSDFIMAYGVKSIPRFMLFNKEGKVISVNAIRPSDKKIRETLNKYL